MDNPAVTTPEGTFCQSCIPPRLVGKTSFTVYEDAQLDAYPVCEACGHKHTYMELSPLGERFELELKGPRKGDLLLTKCGPSNELRELSIVDLEILGVYSSRQRAEIAIRGREYISSNPDAAFWVLGASGQPELGKIELLTPSTEQRLDMYRAA